MVWVSILYYHHSNEDLKQGSSPFLLDVHYLMLDHHIQTTVSILYVLRVVSNVDQFYVYSTHSSIHTKTHVQRNIESVTRPTERRTDAKKTND
jgi:hypothetical protein